MRVLLLGPYPPPHGGVETHVVALRRFLLGHEIPCAIINITRHRKKEADEIYYPRNAIALIRRLLGLRDDILHLHVGGMLSRRVLRLGLLCTLLPGKKTVFTFHSGGYASLPEAKALTSRSLAGLVLRRFDRLIGVNQQIVNFFHQLGVSRERTRLIAPHAFFDDEVNNGELPEALCTFFSDHQPVLISVGQLEPEYDLPRQIDVMGPVRDKFPNAGLLLLGRGTLENDLRQSIAGKPFAKDILLCGDVAHALAQTAIARADVMLRTTLYDGDAISVREALHLGTPVVATDNGMRPTGVQLVEGASVEALLAAVERTLRSSEANAEKKVPLPDESNLEAVLRVYGELLT
ncbi:MAG: glycosyltransferase family 4 protein [Terriglobales bacterium]